MLIMICNIGSTSFKFQLLNMETEQQLMRGYTERVGTDNAIIAYFKQDQKLFEQVQPVPSHREAVKHALDFLLKDSSTVSTLKEIDGIGFKTIQAGDKNGSVILDSSVLQAMEDFRELAPAHNPPYLTAIYMFRELLPDTPLVGVFEPGFHTDIPDYARIYGTPFEWYEKYGVKKYGYHGASHRYVTGETVRKLGLPQNRHKIITCHLGGSSSLCAFKDGKSMDTSMGFTPQSGLIQGTRIGDMDPFVLPYIMNKTGLNLDDALRACTKNGGLAGISGISEDMREIKNAIEKGNNRARLARDKFIYDIKRYIGEYIVLMEGLDAVTFTGGIGQKDQDLRYHVLQSLHFLGMEVHETRNMNNETIISTDSSRIKALVLNTNEEIVVARETMKVIKNLH